MNSGYVLNEWLFHDLRGDNGTIAQKETAAFLLTFVENSDYTAVIRGSKWTNKAYGLVKCPDQTVKHFGKIIIGSIISVPTKCHLFDRDEIPVLPTEMVDLIPADDHYLFELSIHLGHIPIITTDRRLISSIREHDLPFTLEFRNDFLSKYK